MNFQRAFWLGLAVLVPALLVLPALYFIEFGSASAWTVSVPLADTRMRVKVAPLLRAATSPLGRRLLDGTMWHTGAGSLSVRDVRGKLVVRCAPCSLALPEISAGPVHVPALAISLSRDEDHLDGTLSFTGRHKEQRAQFYGELTDRRIKLDWVLADSDLAEVLAAFQSAVPELRRAAVRGKIYANGTLQLPEMKWTAVPALQGFAVYGLGTERLREGEFEFMCRDTSGRPMKRLTGESHPEWVGLNQMGKWLPRAVLAAEDPHFYQHAGYDAAGLLQILANPERREDRGAGTITQQLARNFLADTEKTGALRLRELLYAVEMERTLGKRRILALYLNTVDWGPGLCGVTDAGRIYFTREPSGLAPLEAAWLAGILRDPQRAYRQEFLANRADPERLSWVAAQIRFSAKQKQPDFTLLEAAPAETPISGDVAKETQ